jgi:alkyl hydroperoxide reductase subunit AhpC
MSQKLYYLYDSKSESYTAPTVNPARGQAIRSFSDAVNGDNGVISQHPADFTLFEVGEFDPVTGEITLYDSKVSVANGLDVKVEA